MLERMRKFGLQYCDLPSMLSNISYMFRLLTINVDPRDTNPIHFLCFAITPVFAAIYTYVYFISVIWFVFVRCIETRDLVAAMIVFPLGFTSEIGVTKFIYVLLNRKKIRILMGKYLECNSAVKPGSRFHKTLLEYLRVVKRRAIIYWLIINVNGVLYIVKPIFMSGPHTMEDIFPLYGLEPGLESPYWEITYLLMALASCFICYLTSNMAVFLIVISGYVEAHLMSLAEELLNLFTDSLNDYHSRPNHSESYKPFRPNNEVEEDENNTETEYNAVNEIAEKRLRNVAINHIININLIIKVNEIFKGAFAVEFIVLSVGLIAELLGGLENTYMAVPFAIIQVAMDCLVGQRLMDACDTFESAVYSCQWERLNASNMKAVYLMLMNSQKTLTLSIGGVAILNFVYLMYIFKSVYSAFTTLQSVM